MITASAHPAPPAAPAAIVRRARVTDDGVVPAVLLVGPSETVVWRNVGRNRHTVTADADGFGSPTLFTGDTFTITAPATPGVYAYHCIFHTYIRGTLDVSPVRLATAGPVNAGRTVALRGTVTGVRAGSPVSVQRRVAGAWVTVADTATGPAGAFTARSPALTAAAVFRALAAGSVSPSVHVAVRPVIAVNLRDARLTVHVRPALPGAAVSLERRDPDARRWRRLTSRRLSAGRAAFTLKAPGTYRAAVGARAGLSPRASRPVGFRLQSLATL